ncbi:MAG: LysR family transcriptional regulator [Pseudomonadota bacterium]
MNLQSLDLNLLRNLDILLNERSVTKAAQRLSMSQPAMSNALKRLRKVFHDPLLIRTSEGMVPTERAQEIQPQLRSVLASVESFLQPKAEFDAADSEEIFRIVASDYAETTLVPNVLTRLRKEAPNVTLDMLTPSDVGYPEVEQGKVDIVINRFEELPSSFHSSVLWHDGFACVMGKNHPASNKLTLKNYLAARHVWVSKTGMGVGFGIDPEDRQRLGWVDAALDDMGETRNIAIFTRHYPAAIQHAEQQDLIATVPCRAAALRKNSRKVAILPPPFPIPDIELTMAWSPLLHHSPAHRWLRSVIRDAAKQTERPSF